MCLGAEGNEKIGECKMKEIMWVHCSWGVYISDFIKQQAPDRN